MEAAAKRWNKGSRGAYVAFAADLATLFLDAWVENCEDWERMKAVAPSTSLKVASFTVRATEKQSIAGSEPLRQRGTLPRQTATWIPSSRAGRPLPLAWHLGRFRVRFVDGSEGEVRGKISFGVY